MRRIRSGRTTFCTGAMLAGTVAFALGGCPPIDPGNGPPPEDCEPSAETTVSFAAAIQPILNARCTICHVSGGFADDIMHLNAAESFGALVGVRSVQDPTLTRVVACEPNASLLILKLTQDNPPVGSRMPLGGDALPASEIELVRTWIAEGAQDN